MLHPRDLKEYQVTAAKFIIKTPRCALWCEMGLGKTVITLTGLREILRFNPQYRVLIIAPKRVCESVWAQEMHKWIHTCHLKSEHIAGSPKNRLKILDNNEQIQLISVDLVKWLVEHYKKKWPYDIVVIDEASCFKDSKTQRFKALKKVIHLSQRVVQLTGTPAPNGLLNVWSQVFLLDKGERLGKTMTAYKYRYFDADYMGYNWTIKPEADKEIHERLEDLCMTLSAEDYLKMPRRIDNVITLPMDSRTRVIYEDLKKDLIIELNNEEVIAPNIAALINKLKQVCNGGVYASNDDKTFQLIHKDKLECLSRIIDEAEGEPVLIAYCFKSDADMIKERFGSLVHDIKEQDVVDKWNRKEIPILIGHPASCGHGLNLQAGSNIMVWYGLTWSLELYQQFNARLHRQGQTKPVIIHHVLMENSVEQLVMQALGNKHLTQQDLLEAMKKDLSAW